jgi:hypothetical protein
VRSKYRVLIGAPEIKRPLGDLGLNGRIILRVSYGTSLGWLRMEIGGGVLSLW